LPKKTKDDEKITQTFRTRAYSLEFITSTATSLPTYPAAIAATHTPARPLWPLFVFFGQSSAPNPDQGMAPAGTRRRGEKGIVPRDLAPVRSQPRQVAEKNERRRKGAQTLRTLVCRTHHLNCNAPANSPGGYSRHAHSRPPSSASFAHFASSRNTSRPKIDLLFVSAAGGLATQVPGRWRNQDGRSRKRDGCRVAVLTPPDEILEPET
jgi:hypothetical protein